MRCTFCGGTGQFELKMCPRKWCGSIAAEVLEAATFMRKGILPIPGGWLDQTQWILDAVRYAWQEEDALKEKRGSGLLGMFNGG